MHAAVPGTAEAKIAQLIDLKSLGPISSQSFVNEVFYRPFANRRQVGAYFGLTGTPFNSGNSERDQGISKAGNSRARALATEMSWLWLRHQPDSELSRWFRDRVGNRRAASAHHHHRIGAQAHGGAVALCDHRRGAGRAVLKPAN